MTYKEVVAKVQAENPEVKTGNMMGMPCLKLRSKMFAGEWHGSMVFKVSGAFHASALALPGVALFDPSGLGRPMKQWVQVPPNHADYWPSLAAAALDGVLRS